MKQNVWILLILLFLLPVQSLSAEEVNEKLVRKIGYQLRCPVCQGLSVKESEAGIAVNMKNKIRELLKEGKTEEEIFQYFEMRYGEWIRRTPKKEGFNLLVWIAPFIVIFIGLGLVVMRAKKNASPKGEEVVEIPLTADEQKAIEQKLKSMEQEPS